jgi:hypothetical protein
VHPSQRPDARDAPARADDDPAVDLLAEDGVGAADVGGAFGSDRRGLDPKPALPQCRGRLFDDLVPGLPAPDQGEVEVAAVDVEPDDRPVQEPQGLVQQLLAGLVSVEDGHGGDGPAHRLIIWSDPSRIPRRGNTPATIDRA